MSNALKRSDLIQNANSIGKTVKTNPKKFRFSYYLIRPGDWLMIIIFPTGIKHCAKPIAHPHTPKAVPIYFYSTT